MTPINWAAYMAAMKDFRNATPFPHAVIDNFLFERVLDDVVAEWPLPEDERWTRYHNILEDKYTCNKWDAFGPATYTLFSWLSSPGFVQTLGQHLGELLIPDIGLHGGGLHMHGPGGRNGAHLDYSIHPKIKLERRLNIIIYVGEKMLPAHGGHFGLWTDPDTLNKEIEPKFNRAIIFDTRDAWHGMSRTVAAPPGVFRKSLAMYYLGVPAKNARPNQRVQFGLTQEQKKDPALQEFVAKRGDLAAAKEVYNVKS